MENGHFGGEKHKHKIRKIEEPLAGEVETKREKPRGRIQHAKHTQTQLNNTEQNGQKSHAAALTIYGHVCAPRNRSGDKSGEHWANAARKVHRGVKNTVPQTKFGG